MTFDEWLMITDKNPVHQQDAWDAGVAEGRRELAKEVKDLALSIAEGENATALTVLHGIGIFCDSIIDPPDKGA